MNAVLDRWNNADEPVALEPMLSCCGSRRWAAAMVARRPIATLDELSAIADSAWETMLEADWREAFASHPRIGERDMAHAGSRAAGWSSQEQASAQGANQPVMAALADGNTRYEERFGFTYIVCATGKTADEMLCLLDRRIANGHDAELREAAEQQRQIMQLRLLKWVTS